MKKKNKDLQIKHFQHLIENKEEYICGIPPPPRVLYVLLRYMLKIVDGPLGELQTIIVLILASYMNSLWGCHYLLV